MQKYPKWLALFSLLIIIQPLFANTKPLPGYYIGMNGDTVHCNIEFEDWYITPSTIRVMTGNNTKVFGVNDIEGFGIYGYGDYRSLTVNYHLNPISGANLPETFSDSMENAKVFLKVLTTGYYSLYELTLSGRFYYFIQERDGPISELIFRVAQKDMEVKEDQQYKNLLNGLFLSAGLLYRYQQRIINTQYNGPALRSLIDILNDTHDHKTTKRAKKKNFELDVFAGGMMLMYPSGFNGAFATNGKFSPSVSPSGGLNLLYIIPNHFNRIKVGFSVAYLTYNARTDQADSIPYYSSYNFYYTTYYREKLSISRTAVLTTIHGSYGWDIGNIKLYLKFGVSVHFVVSGDKGLESYSSYTRIGVEHGNVPINEAGEGSREILPFKGVYPHLTGGVGIEAGRSKLEAGYYSPTQISTIDNAPFKAGMAGLYYYYSILR